MRVFISALIGLLFTATFLAFFLMSSLLDFVQSPTTLLATAQEQRVREDIVALTADYIATEVAADDSLQPMSVAQLEVIVGQVISEEWLEDSLILAHTALHAAFHGAEESAVLDLRATKAALATALQSLKVEAARNCEQFWGPQLCSDQEASSLLMARFEDRALLAIASIADQIDLMQSLQGSNRATATELKDGLESIQSVRMLSLAILIMSLAIFMALGSRPLRLLVLRTGILAMVASAVYLLTVAVSESLAHDGVQKGALEVSEKHAIDSQLEQFTSELVRDLVSAAISGSTMPVALIGVAGFVGVSLVVLLGRR